MDVYLKFTTITARSISTAVMLKVTTFDAYKTARIGG